VRRNRVHHSLLATRLYLRHAILPESLPAPCMIGFDQSSGPGEAAPRLNAFPDADKLLQFCKS
jgi:hypothetical protein